VFFAYVKPYNSTPWRLNIAFLAEYNIFKLVQVILYFSHFEQNIPGSLPHFKTTHTHTTVLRLSGFCPGQTGWAGTRRNIHPFTPIMVINRPLSASSI